MPEHYAPIQTPQPWELARSRLLAARSKWLRTRILLSTAIRLSPATRRSCWIVLLRALVSHTHWARSVLLGRGREQSISRPARSQPAARRFSRWVRPHLLTRRS